MKAIRILKVIEPYYVLLSYGFIAFFFVITGTVTIPILVELYGKGSFTPIFYALCIIFAYMYFAYYKVAKLILEDDGK